MIWLGIDDTDSPRGGCTTFTLTGVLDLARELGIDLIGEPRLVRLNPNVPWKTRGNAALSARFGRGVGPRRRVGSVGGRPIWSFASGARIPRSNADAFLERAWERVRSLSRSGDPGTDPALVMSDHRLPARLYWDAVQEIVPIESVRAELRREGAEWRTEGSDRGLVGASAAVAWPGGHPTWELIAYRTETRQNSPREVDRGSVADAQRAHPELFLCEDPRTRRLLVAPHTACPILFGIRATAAPAALRALPTIRSEPVDRWVLFRTNQATGDHLRPRLVREIGPYRSAIVDGTVTGSPAALPGGHVRVSIADREGTPLECLAFEPTKTLPAVARTLWPGDHVRLWGSRAADAALRLEGIQLLRLVPRSATRRPLRCPECDRRARSMGRDRGFRCPGCHRRWPPEQSPSRTEAPVYRPGTYHPTPSARRHLAPRGPEP